MSNPDKHPLQLILESTDHAEDMRSYSGRGMHGKACLGVVISCTLGDFFADVMSASFEEHRLGGDDAADDPLQEIAEAFRSMRTDSMGRDTIVYFPGVSYVEGADEYDPVREACADEEREMAEDDSGEECN